MHTCNFSSAVQHTKNRGVNGFIKTNMTELPNIELQSDAKPIQSQ